MIEGFTKRYQTTRLVHFEEFDQVYEAIAMEKQIKAWTRRKKLDLVRSDNPKWQDPQRELGGVRFLAALGMTS